MNIIEEVRKFVEEECKKDSSKYGYEIFKNHFVSAANYARILSNKINSDKEVIEIAIWLHDIGSIIYGRENHNITGAKIAENKLKELEYPAEKLELVKKCILNHRGNVKSKTESNEEKIIVDADALSAFDHIEGQFKADLVYENKSLDDARISVRTKLINSWNKLVFEESKKLIEPKYRAAMELLS